MTYAKNKKNNQVIYLVIYNSFTLLELENDFKGKTYAVLFFQSFVEH